MNKKKTIKLSEDVEIDIIYHVDDKTIATVNVFKEKRHISSTYIGVLRFKDKK